MSAPSGTPSPSPLSKNKRQISAIGCIPCAGNSNECCGAPGGYALVYHNTPDVDSSAGSVITASYTSYSSLSATSVIAYTSSSVTEASFTSYSSISASSFVPDTSSSTITSTSSSSAEPTNYFTPLTLTYDSATGSISSITFDTSTSLAASSTIVSTSSNTIISTSSSIAESNSDFAPSTLTYNSTTGSTSTVTFVTPTTFAPITSAPISSSSASGNSSSGSFNSSTYSSSFGTGSGTGFAFSPSPSSFAPYPSQTLFNTSVYSTAAISSSRSASYSSQTEYPPPATPSSSSAPNTSMNPTTAAPSSSSTPGLSIAGAQGSNSDATTTTNGSATATSSGGPEPTVESPTPSCVQAANYTGNNTIYNDYFGFTYDIRCNLDLQSTPTDHDAYAGSFEECLEYCSLLTDCVAVTYEDPASPPQNLSNCYPKWDFGGYTASSTDGLYSGVDVNGPSPGTLENQDLCTTNNEQDSSYDGQTYYDDFGQAWAIGCNNTVAIASSEALYPTVADTLASCIDYCSVYEACNALNWLGPHTNGTTNDPNCFPASSNETAGAAGSAPGSGYAVLVPF